MRMNVLHFLSASAQVALWQGNFNLDSESLGGLNQQEK